MNYMVGSAEDRCAMPVSACVRTAVDVADAVRVSGTLADATVLDCVAIALLAVDTLSTIAGLVSAHWYTLRRTLTRLLPSVVSDHWTYPEHRSSVCHATPRSP